MVAVKLRGMPWRVSLEEIEEFLEGFKWVRDSIRIGELEGGRKTGQGSVMFESEDEANRCMEEKEGEYIGPRFVNINLMTFAEHSSFMDDQLGCINVHIDRILNEDNISTCVKLRGMPRDITKEQVIEFFGDIEIDEDAIHLEIKFGRRTGLGLVFCKTEDDR